MKTDLLHALKHEKEFWTVTQKIQIYNITLWHFVDWTISSTVYIRHSPFTLFRKKKWKSIEYMLMSLTTKNFALLSIAFSFLYTLLFWSLFSSSLLCCNNNVINSNSDKIYYNGSNYFAWNRSKTRNISNALIIIWNSSEGTWQRL